MAGSNSRLQDVSSEPIGEGGSSEEANDIGEEEKEGYVEGEQVQENDSGTSEGGRYGPSGEEINQRCSSRANKGIPPARFGEWI